MLLYCIKNQKTAKKQ